MNTVLFLCTGNYYRSRYAEIVFNWRAAELNVPWRADSRGLAPDPNNVGPISRYTLRAIQRLGIALEGEPRLPIRATLSDFQAAHHVVAVKEAEHLSLVASSFPSHLERVEFWHVHDLDCCGPEEALPQLDMLVRGLIDRLSSQHAGGERALQP
jgi:protein-tyrosine phosphatase